MLFTNLYSVLLYLVLTHSARKPRWGKNLFFSEQKQARNIPEIIHSVLGKRIFAFRMVLIFLLLSSIPVIVLGMFYNKKVVYAILERDREIFRRESSIIESKINWFNEDWKDERKTEADKTNIYLTIIDANGGFRYSELKNEDHKKLISDFVQRHLTQNFRDTILVGRTDREVFYFNKSKTGNDIICLYTPTGSSISIVFGLERELLQIVLVGFVFFFIISGAVIYQIVGMPLREISLAVENFTKGAEVPKLVTSDYDDEVKDLAESFVRMTSRINATIADLDEISFLYKAVLKNTPIFHFVVSGNGEVKLLEGKALGKISLNGKTGDHYSVVFSAYPELISAITEGIKIGSINTIIQLHDLTFVLSLFPFEDSIENKGSFVGVCEDITDEAKQRKLLEEREARYRLLAENSTDIITLHDQKGKILYISPSCEHILLYTPEELTGKLLIEFVHPEDEPVYNVLLSSTFQKPDRANFSYRMLKADGDFVWVESIVKTISGSTNEEFTFQMVTRDISERRKTIDLLISSEKRFRMVWEKSLDAFRITDRNGIMIDVNEAFCHLVKIPRSDLLGKPFYTIYDENHYTQQQIMKDYLESFENLEETSVVEAEIFLKNRENVLVDLNFIILETEKNNKVLLSVFRDVTEKRRALNQIMMLSRAVQQSPAIAMITDLDGIIIYVNNAFERITGYTFTEVEGKKPTVLKSGTMDELIYKELWEKITNGEEWMGEIQNKKKNGELYWESVLISPIRNDKDIPIAYLKVSEDITRRKNMELDLRRALDAAEESDRLKTMLLANVSHEFRTPLNVILGFSNILKNDSDQTEIEMFSNKIHKSAMRLLDTVDMVMTLSQLESGMIKIKQDNVNVVSIANYISSRYKLDAEEKGLQFSLTYSDHDLQCVADEELLNKALIYLFDNAVKFTKSGSVSVRIEEVVLEDNQKNVRIDVADTGIGISENDMQIIFKAFKQVHEGYNRQFEGLGLGLTNAEKIVKAMNGRLEVQSEVNKGSLFRLYLPSSNS